MLLAIIFSLAILLGLGILSAILLVPVVLIVTFIMACIFPIFWIVFVIEILALVILVAINKKKIEFAYFATPIMRERGCLRHFRDFTKSVPHIFVERNQRSYERESISKRAN